MIVNVERQTLAGKKFDIDGFASKLEDMFLTQVREPSSRAKVSFAPSGIGYRHTGCARYWHYALNGGVMREEDTDAMGQNNMMNGIDVHARLQKLFEESDLQVQTEVEVKLDSPPIRGYADLLLMWNGKKTVGEIKTTRSESWVAKKAKNEAADYHMVQILLYMHILKLEQGFVLYYNNNTGEIFIVPVYWNTKNKALVENVINWLNEVYAAYEEDKKPTRAGRSEASAICKYCPFNKHCWSDEDKGDISIKSLVIK